MHQFNSFKILCFILNVWMVHHLVECHVSHIPLFLASLSTTTHNTFRYFQKIWFFIMKEKKKYEREQILLLYPDFESNLSMPNNFIYLHHCHHLTQPNMSC